MTSIDIGRHGIARFKHIGRQYRLTPINHWFREKECPRCGRHEVLVPFNAGIVLCANCLKRWARSEELITSGRVQPFYAYTGQVRCMECGGWSPVLYYVNPGKLCLKCIWEKYGGQRGPLKVEGVRW